MADELPEVEQKFVADMDEYLGELEAGADEAQAFADANREAASAVGDMRDHAAETGAALDDLAAQAEGAKEADDGLRDSAAEAAAALDEERNKALEAAAAAGIYADKLGTLHEANGRFLSGAKAAELGIDKFKDDLKDAKGKADELDQSTRSLGDRLRSLLMLGGGSGGGGGFSLPEGIPGIGGMPVAALIAIIPAIYAALVEVTGLVSGLAAAGAGAGAFALLAIPAFDAVKNALGDTHKQLMKLPADERAAVESIRSLESEWKSMSKAFEPDVFKVFNSGLRLARELLPDVAPFADTFATSLDGLLKRADGFADSKGFKDWLAQFHQLEGPSITAIGDGIGKVAGSVGKLLTTMSAKDDVHAINIAFGALTGTINSVSYVVRKLMQDWDAYSSAFRTVRHNLSADTAAMRIDFVHAGHDIEAAWNSTVHALESDTDSFREHWVAAGHAIESDTDAMREDFVGFGHSVESVYNSVRHALAADTDAMREDFVAGGHAIEATWNSVISFFRSIPGKAESALSGLPGDLERMGENAILGFLHGVEAEGGSVLSYVGHLASEVGSIFSSILRMGSPSRLFYEHGVNTLQGYINGLKATAPAVRSAMAEVAGGVAAGGVGTAGGSATAPSVHVTVPLTLGAGTQGYNDPRFLQYLQQVVQEAVLRFADINPSNGFGLPGKLS